MKILSYPALVLAAILSGISTYSQTNDKPLRQTEIKCNGPVLVENDGTNASFIFNNNVQLSATNLDMRCDRLEAYTLRRGPEDAPIGDFSPIQRIVAIGDVSITQAERTATAGRLEMKPNEDSIHLYDNPVVVQAGVTFSGPELIIERGKGRIFIPGNGNELIRFVGPPIRDFGFDEDDPEQMEEAVKPPVQTGEDSDLGEPINENTPGGVEAPDA